MRLTKLKLFSTILATIAGLAGCLRWLTLVGLALPITLVPAPSSAQSSRDSPLEKKVAAVLPSKDEDRWLEIDWHTNLAEARREAERQGKPVLLWVMNGNPLGCG